MALVTNSFEGGTAGTAITTGNSGGASGTAITLLSKAGAASVNFSATGKAHGSLAAQVICNGGTDSYRIRWDYTADTGGMLSARFYITFQALPSVLQYLGLAVSSGGQVRVGISATNGLGLYNLSGTLIGASSPTVTVGTTYRVELQVKKGTTTTDGQAAFQVYVGDSATLFHSASSTTTNTGTADWVQWHFGEASVRTINVTFDDLRLDNTTQAPLGALQTNTAPVSNAGPDQTVASYATVTLTGAGSTDAESSVTYAWSQTGGVAVSLSSATAVSPTFTAPATVAGATLTFSLVVTDAGGLTSSDTVVVTVLPHVEWLMTAGGIVPLRAR